jgi:uncharacterized protein YjbJ (UPF0337 family)
MLVRISSATLHTIVGDIIGYLEYCAGKEVKGKIKEAAGVMTDNKEWQAEGKIEKTEGKAEQKVGSLKRKLKEDEYEDEDI